MRWIGGRAVKFASVAVLATAVLAGCSDNKATHKENVTAAKKRWQTMRSTQMLAMAQQQFDTGDLETAESTLLEAISVDPQNARLHVLAGRIGLERSELERAHQRFTRAIEYDDEFAYAHYYRGIVLQRWKQYPEARAAYERAWELQPDNVVFLLAISEMHVALGDIDAAVALLEGKVGYFAHNGGIRLALGQLYGLKNDFKSAARWTREAAILIPDDTGVQEDLAYTQLKAGLYAEAARTFERLTRQTNATDRPALFHAVARAYTETDRLQDAKAVYLDLRRAHPRDAEVWIKLAEIAWADEQYTDALFAARRAITFAKDRPEAYIIAGMVWQKRDRTAEALEMFDTAARVAPDSAEPLLLRGITLQRAGKLAAAAEAYREAKQRQPNDARVDQLLSGVSQVDE